MNIFEKALWESQDIQRRQAVDRDLSQRIEYEGEMINRDFSETVKSISHTVESDIGGLCKSILGI